MLKTGEREKASPKDGNQATAHILLENANERTTYMSILDVLVFSW